MLETRADFSKIERAFFIEVRKCFAVKFLKFENAFIIFFFSQEISFQVNTGTIMKIMQKDSVQ